MHNKNEEIVTVGWDAINNEFDKLYPNQEPLHFGTLICWRLGGDDPLDGIRIYETEDFYHFVSYGLSELYEKESKDKEFSGFGFELTCKLSKDNANNDDEIKCIAGIFQSLARYVFENGAALEDNQYIYTGQTSGIDSKGKSNLVGFLLTRDNLVNTIYTPNGKVEFIQIFGATEKELKSIIDKNVSTKELIKKFKQKDVNMVMDLKRNSIL